MGIYLSVPVWFLLPEPYADLGRRWGTVLLWSQKGIPSAERWTVLMWWWWWSGKRLSTFSEEIMSKGIGLK